MKKLLMLLLFIMLGALVDNTLAVFCVFIDKALLFIGFDLLKNY